MNLGAVVLRKGFRQAFIHQVFISTKGVRKAGIIIIGDEILKGQTKDTNTFFLTQNLRKLGVSVDRVSVIPDDIGVIAEEIRRFSDTFDFVLTSGGIGPTHDDLTYEGVAEAFKDKCHYHPHIVDFCSTWFKKNKADLSDPCFKLALIPRQAELNFGIDQVTGKPTIYPVVSVRNVFIFPGIPELLQKAFRNLGGDLFESNTKFETEEVFLAKDEISLTKDINRLVTSHPLVTFGSYPSWSSRYYRTQITLEAPTRDLIRAARADMEDMGPTHYDPHPAENSYSKIQEFLSRTDDQELVTLVRDSLAIVEESFTRYEPSQVSVCFNGGKDCIVMLHLVHAVHQNMFPEADRLKSFYIRENKTFPEVDTFMESAVAEYSLASSEYSGPMKPALACMLEKEGEVEAAFLGVRTGDPGWRMLSTFSLTDGDWPRVMRINPILSWGFRDIWTFLRGMSLPYPTLYDEGYTSLGNPDNTVPNPALAYRDPKTGQERFRPAYMLEDPSLERKGRL